MTGPPAARPIIQEAGGAGPRGRNINPNYVRVINAPWNRHARYALKRKTAEHYVRNGRAEWVGPTTLRMIESEELAAMRTRSAEGYNNHPNGTVWRLAVGVSGGASVMLGIRTEPRPQRIDTPNQTDSAVINAVAAGKRARAASLARGQERSHQSEVSSALPAQIGSRH